MPRGRIRPRGCTSRPCIATAPCPRIAPSVMATGYVAMTSTGTPTSSATGVQMSVSTLGVSIEITSA